MVMPMWTTLLALLVLLAAQSVAHSAAAADAENPRRAQLLERLGRNVHAMQLVRVQPLSAAERQRVRVLCWVNTYHANHEARVRAIQRTWGRRCDKILFMSDVEDPEIPTVRVMAPPLHETLWQKHREIVRLLAREFRDGEFDWVFKCDDDTFLLVENLKRYLLSPEIQAIPKTKPTLLGHRMTLQWCVCVCEWMIESECAGGCRDITRQRLRHDGRSIDQLTADAHAGGRWSAPFIRSRTMTRSRSRTLRR